MAELRVSAAGPWWIGDEMSRDEAINKLKALQTMRDLEIAHANADDVICDLLKSLGYEEVIVEYEKIDKWYA